MVIDERYEQNYERALQSYSEIFGKRSDYVERGTRKLGNGSSSMGIDEEYGELEEQLEVLGKKLEIAKRLFFTNY